MGEGAPLAARAAPPRTQSCVALRWSCDARQKRRPNAGQWAALSWPRSLFTLGLISSLLMRSGRLRARFHFLPACSSRWGALRGETVAKVANWKALGGLLEVCVALQWVVRLSKWRWRERESRKDERRPSGLGRASSCGPLDAPSRLRVGRLVAKVSRGENHLSARQRWREDKHSRGARSTGAYRQLLSGGGGSDWWRNWWRLWRTTQLLDATSRQTVTNELRLLSRSGRPACTTNTVAHTLRLRRPCQWRLLCAGRAHQAS